MFGFFRRSSSRPLSDAIGRALAGEDLAPAGSNLSRLRMVESRGRYSDRKVTYFRVFDPALAAESSLNIQSYRDLDAFQALILRSGHVEQDGKVIVNRAVVVRAPDQPIRTRAGRPVPAAEADAVVRVEGDAPDGAPPAETRAADRLP